LFFIKIQKNREVMEKETMKNVPDVPGKKSKETDKNDYFFRKDE